MNKNINNILEGLYNNRLGCEINERKKISDEDVNPEGEKNLDKWFNSIQSDLSSIKDVDEESIQEASSEEFKFTKKEFNDIKKVRESLKKLLCGEKFYDYESAKSAIEKAVALVKGTVKVKIYVNDMDAVGKVGNFTFTKSFYIKSDLDKDYVNQSDLSMFAEDLTMGYVKSKYGDNRAGYTPALIKFIDNKGKITTVSNRTYMIEEGKLV